MSGVVNSYRNPVETTQAGADQKKTNRASRSAIDRSIIELTGGVAELADALDLGSSSFTGVQVRFLSPPFSVFPAK